MNKKIVTQRIAMLLACLIGTTQVQAEHGDLPNCVDRIYKFKYPLLPVKKDVLRNNTGCDFTVNWQINEDNKRPNVIEVLSSDACAGIASRLQKAWRKSLLYKGEAIAHCQTQLTIKCPNRKRPCRFNFDLPEDDPIMSKK